MAEEAKQATQDDGVVSAKSAFLEKEGYEQVQVDYKFPETVEGLVEKFGENIVHSNAVGSMTVSLQGNLRRWSAAMIKPKEEGGPKGEVDADKLQSLADNWKPGVVNRQKKSPVDKALKVADGIDSTDDLDSLIAALQAKKAAKK